MSSVDVAAALFQGPFSYLWPLLLVPALASFLSDSAVRWLPRAKADWRLTAALAALPGMIMLALVVVTVSRSASDFHADSSWQHAFKHRVTPLLAVMILTHAVVKAWMRARAVQRLTQLRLAAPPRLAAAAHAVGVRVFEIPLFGCECFVAGFWKPTVFVSTGTISQMSDAELRAALQHERAHARGRDPAVLTILSFLHDLAPGSRRALTAYRESRERFADQEAIKNEGVIPLASALLVASKAAGVGVPAMSMSGTGAVAWRLEAILQAERPPTTTATSMVPAISVLLLNSALTGWPLLHYHMDGLLCSL